MKQFKNSLIIISVISVLAFSCTNCDPALETMEFEANFFTVLKGFVEDGAPCSGSKNYLNIQEGEGSATGLGNFTTKISFCVDINTFEYINGEGSFVSETGETIFFQGSGQVKPSDHPDYDLEFQDTFTIIGGTGQFEGATGTLTTDSYVKNETQQTDHIWSGTITLRK